MKNLLRAAAVCALTLTALSTVEAATFGKCLIRCYPMTFPPASITTSTTQAECCGGNFDHLCPAGSSGYGVAWNSYRC